LAVVNLIANRHPFVSVKKENQTMKNVSSFDRFLRLVLGIVAIELAVFWLTGNWQLVAYGVGAVLVLTAASRFCPLYRTIGISTCGVSDKAWGSGAKTMAAVLLLTAVAGGSYASLFFTRKVFMEDFNAMNHSYKQTLFFTGKNEREKALANYDQLRPAYQAFADKYTSYQPYALKGDRQLTSDLARVGVILVNVDGLVRTGDLHQAHLALEQVRPVFQEILKRNGFSLLAVSLVDFHDAMELILDAANAKDAPKVIALYPQVSDKLKAVEEQVNDDEIAAIRKNLDDVLDLAKGTTGDPLPAKADALKSSFIKVYLQRG
jgi:hypothetical protein